MESEPCAENSYIAWREGGREALVVDPGFDPESIVAILQRERLGLAAIPDVSVEGVTYDHSKRIEFQNETRRKALLKAKEKAAKGVAEKGLLDVIPRVLPALVEAQQE